MDALGILTQQVNESRIASIMILPDNGATFQDYLDFIKYKPSFWNIESNRKLKRLIKYEKWVEKSFENIVDDKVIKSQSALDTYIFMSGIDFNDYAKLKLTNEQLQLCYKRVYDYIDFKDYRHDEDDKVVETYTNYLIRMISVGRKDKLDDNIKKRVKRSLLKNNIIGE